MLQTMRSHAGSWLIKFMLAAIVASFALWGITDIIRGYSQSRPIASVGKQMISVEEFGHTYKNAIANMQRIAKSPLTPEQLKEIGFPNQVLENLIDKAVVEQEMHSAGIVVSDKTVKQEIHAIPAFLTQQGHFDRATFEQILGSQGMNEGRFLKEVRDELQQHQFVDGLTSGLDLSDEYARLLFQALEQPIQFVTVDIPFKKMTLPKIIRNEDVKLFYSANKEQFRLPELRTLTLVCFDREALKKNITIPAEEMREEYERRQQDFSTPEKRHVEAITVTSSDTAKKIFDMYKAGKPLKTIAREVKGVYKDLGIITKAEMNTTVTASGWKTAAEVHSNEVFSLDTGVTSKALAIEPVHNGPAYQSHVVYVVSKIVPGSQKSLNEAEAAIESALKDERFNGYFESLQNQVEDALASGEKIQEVAHKYGLIIENLKGIDKFGRDIDGNKALNEDIRKETLAYAFSNNQGSESGVILARAAGKESSLVGVIVRVDAVQASYIPKFEEVQVKVTEAYKADLQNKAASTMARDIVKNARSVDDLKKQAATHKVTLANLPAISRSNVNENISLREEMMAETIERMFALPEGEALIAPTKNGFKVIMFQSKLTYAFNNERFEKFKSSVKQMTVKDFQQSYRSYLRHTLYPVTINPSQVELVVGRS